jgi:sn-glycerol 3-phosphate transport system substrate-binding protein
MEETMKKISIVLICSLLAFSSLFANGTQETAPAAAGQGEGPVRITFWHTFGDAKRRGWIQDVVKQFNASQDKYVVSEETKGSYRDTLQAALLAYKQGTAPSLVHIAEAGSQLAYDTGMFTPVGDIGTFDTSDYIQPVLNYYTIGGKVNSIPFNSSSPVLYINTDMLVAAGYPADYVPKTFGDVLAALSCGKEEGRQGRQLLRQPQRLVLRAVDERAGRLHLRQRQRPRRPRDTDDARLPRGPEDRTVLRRPS